VIAIYGAGRFIRADAVYIFGVLDTFPKFVHAILLSFVLLLPVSVDVWADAPTHALILCNVKDVNCLIDGKLSRFDKEISGYPNQQTGKWHSGKWYALYAPLDVTEDNEIYLDLLRRRKKTDGLKNFELLGDLPCSESDKLAITPSDVLLEIVEP